MAFDLKIYSDNPDSAALNQIYTLISQPPFEGSRVRIMPDVHAGKNCVVGFTATKTDRIIPNVIGVDIGCGMLTVRLGKIDFNPAELDDFINRKIPAGSEVRESYDDLCFVENLRCYKQLSDKDKIYRSLGTLGGGNHFIEVDRDSNGCFYLVIHTGSRNLGLQVAKYYQAKAVELCKSSGEEEKKAAHDTLMAEGRAADLPGELERISKKYAKRTKTPAEFCYFEGAETEDYLYDIRRCQEFAVMNRRKIADDILRFLKIRNAESFETMHNFIDDEGVIRKGAVPAHEGETLLIPMNMRDGCIIAEGKGNPDWNFSAPHGAGRLYSRSESKEFFTMDEYKEAMKGIYTSSAKPSTLDESPMVYKPMEEIVRLIEPTVTIKSLIKPVYNFKASD